jgi:hypothetical protein
MNIHSNNTLFVSSMQIECKIILFVSVVRTSKKERIFFCEICSSPRHDAWWGHAQHVKPIGRLQFLLGFRKYEAKSRAWQRDRHSDKMEIQFKDDNMKLHVDTSFSLDDVSFFCVFWSCKRQYHYIFFINILFFLFYLFFIFLRVY